jgi:phosphoribosylformylglycinamidine synthase
LERGRNMYRDIMRIFVEKKFGFNIEAKKLLKEIREEICIGHIKNLRIVNSYQISDISEQEYKDAVKHILSDVTVDNVYEEVLPLYSEEIAFGIEYLPGQYNQRSESAADCIQILTQKARPLIHSSKIIILEGRVTEEELNKIKRYCINPVDSRESSLNKKHNLHIETINPKKVEYITDFINMAEDELKCVYKDLELAMSFEDLKFCQDYFKYKEHRNPTIAEIRVIDTYWSDHCRHTTFLTELNEIEIEEGKYTKSLTKSYEYYIKTRNTLYKDKYKPMTLMDIATIGMKKLIAMGKLENLDVSDEINACSIKVDVDVNGVKEPWLVMFKNETHNHPTEIEPFGGAATCLGGAIRDPLSGRSYVYQAMRITGSGDPRESIEDTLQGKLPQRKITTEAARGYSSYGNQIGLATGHVEEIYHERFIAKRMEIGAVIGAAPQSNVLREKPKSGDKVILLGGRTGRDGCGGATGSSKQHTEESIFTCGAEVQKGNAPTERKIQRLFRNVQVSRLIKRCNDFGAGGVAVAIGELAEGLIVDLDLVPKKYEGLDGTELAISESQERMAVVVSEENVDAFIKLAEEENLEASVVAEVSKDERLIMRWKDEVIVNLSREFLSSNGAKTYSGVLVKAPEENSYFKHYTLEDKLKEQWEEILQHLNICSQKGLVESFDSTVGSGTVLMPFGGRYQLTPSEAMAAKIPVTRGDTKTATVMAHGYNPYISIWSPYHGAVYSIVEAVTKVVSLGIHYKNIKLSLQEYFERLGNEPERWGKPFAALLGALKVQKELGIGAIGGKDSMSGSFKAMDVPPTLVAFAVGVSEDCSTIVTNEFKRTDSKVVFVKSNMTEEYLPDFDKLKRNYDKIYNLIKDKKVLSVYTVKNGGICEAISKMCFGNKIGFQCNDDLKGIDWFFSHYGSFVLEVSNGMDLDMEFKNIDYVLLGNTMERPAIFIQNEATDLENLIKKWSEPLKEIFPEKTKAKKEKILEVPYNKLICKTINTAVFAKPRVFIPVFPGTNCEYDSQKAFERVGAYVNTFVFNNLDSMHISSSIDTIVNEISKAQIIMIPGGFSAGDEPDGSGKFIAAVFRNPRIKEAVMEFLKNRDGLMLGICNGFQALIKLGLVPFGEIRELDENSPTLTYNEIGRHVSCMVNTKVVSKLSPWFSGVNLGDVHTLPLSHGEGRFVGSRETIEELFRNGQVATQYVDLSGNPTMDMPYNPNGSFYAIEGITSPDGRVLGKMAHSERIGKNLYMNISGSMDQKIFESGVNYFR